MQYQAFKRNFLAAMMLPTDEKVDVTPSASSHSGGGSCSCSSGPGSAVVIPGSISGDFCAPTPGPGERTLIFRNKGIQNASFQSATFPHSVAAALPVWGVETLPVSYRPTATGAGALQVVVSASGATATPGTGAPFYAIGYIVRFSNVLQGVQEVPVTVTVSNEQGITRPVLSGTVIVPGSASVCVIFPTLADRVTDARYEFKPVHHSWNLPLAGGAAVLTTTTFDATFDGTMSVQPIPAHAAGGLSNLDLLM